MEKHINTSHNRNHIWKQAEEFICECGILVKGRTKNMLKYNLKVHRKGIMHKQIISNLNQKEGGL